MSKYSKSEEEIRLEYLKKQEGDIFEEYEKKYVPKDKIEKEPTKKPIENKSSVATDKVLISKPKIIGAVEVVDKIGDVLSNDTDIIKTKRLDDSLKALLDILNDGERSKWDFKKQLDIDYGELAFNIANKIYMERENPVLRFFHSITGIKKKQIAMYNYLRYIPELPTAPRDSSLPISATIDTNSFFKVDEIDYKSIKAIEDDTIKNWGFYTLLNTALNLIGQIVVRFGDGVLNEMDIVKIETTINNTFKSIRVVHSLSSVILPSSADTVKGWQLLYFVMWIYHNVAVRLSECIALVHRIRGYTADIKESYSVKLAGKALSDIEEEDGRQIYMLMLLERITALLKQKLLFVSDSIIRDIFIHHAKKDSFVLKLVYNNRVVDAYIELIYERPYNIFGKILNIFRREHKKKENIKPPMPPGEKVKREVKYSVEPFMQCAKITQRLLHYFNKCFYKNNEFKYFSSLQGEDKYRYLSKMRIFRDYELPSGQVVKRPVSGEFLRGLQDKFDKLNYIANDMEKHVKYIIEKKKRYFTQMEMKKIKTYLVGNAQLFSRIISDLELVVQNRDSLDVFKALVDRYYKIVDSIKV